MSTLYMLIGVPGSGKTYWAGNNLVRGTYYLLSTDAYIELEAQRVFKTYNDIFQSHIKIATERMNAFAESVFVDGFDDGRDIIWDQTNLTVKSRKAKLSMVPAKFKKVAVYFKTPNAEEHERRLKSRPGKTIPHNVLNNMIKSIEPPTKEEGFDEIIIVNGE